MKRRMKCIWSNIKNYARSCTKTINLKNPASQVDRQQSKETLTYSKAYPEDSECHLHRYGFSQEDYSHLSSLEFARKVINWKTFIKAYTVEPGLLIEVDFFSIAEIKFFFGWVFIFKEAFIEWERCIELSERRTGNLMYVLLSNGFKSRSSLCSSSSILPNWSWLGLQPRFYIKTERVIF